MKVLFCASECVPFVKTGGLADVAGALPVALRQEGVDVRVILPKYRSIDEYWKNRMEHVCSFEILFGWEKLYCGIERLVDKGVTYYFVDNESFFYVSEIYGDGLSEGLRFAFFLPRRTGSAAAHRILSGRAAPQRLADGPDCGAAQDAVYRQRGLYAHPYRFLHPQPQVSGAVLLERGCGQAGAGRALFHL